MYNSNSTMSSFDRDKVFGVEETSDVNIAEMEPCYEVEAGKAGEADYLRQQVYRDKGNNYFLAISGGTDASFGFGTRYQLNGKEAVVPISPEALAVWAETNLGGQEYERAVKEFRRAPETIWTYQQDGVCEFL